MDKMKFDALTRAFATGTSRRSAIKGLFGGAVGVAVATTRLNPAGAQPISCTPETVLEDCPLPDECTTAVCLQTGESYECAYSSDCDEKCCPGGVCQECCDNTDCPACYVCSGGSCEYACSDCEDCVNGSCVYSCEGVCCDDVCYGEGQCCDVSDCVDSDATFCSSVECQNHLCTAVPECPSGLICCGYGQEGAYCAECCDDDDCGCGYCNQGWCVPYECCEDVDCGSGCLLCHEHECLGACSQKEECCDGECVDLGDCCGHVGDWCGLEPVSDDSPQLDCCDGLVCCENWNSQGSICAECCNDWDCPKGAWCNEGWCEWPDYCDSDKECPKGTCCCKDGSCSGKCCDKPHPPKPPKPAPPAPAPETPVTTLPATGVGESSDSSGLLGAAALGAAAALYAARKMRDTPEGSTEA